MPALIQRVVMHPNYLFAGSSYSGMETAINLLKEHFDFPRPGLISSGFLADEYMSALNFGSFANSGFYFKGDGAITREYNGISQLNNNIRVVLFLRDPIERAFEQFRESSEYGNQINFLEAIKLDTIPIRFDGNPLENNEQEALLNYAEKHREQFICKSSYCKLVRHFMAQLQGKQIKIVFFENLRPEL